jgi:hypothetical protein
MGGAGGVDCADGVCSLPPALFMSLLRPGKRPVLGAPEKVTQVGTIRPTGTRPTGQRSMRRRLTRDFNG